MMHRVLAILGDYMQEFSIFLNVPLVGIEKLMTWMYCLWLFFLVIWLGYLYCHKYGWCIQEENVVQGWHCASGGSALSLLLLFINSLTNTPQVILKLLLFFFFLI